MKLNYTKSIIYLSVLLCLFLTIVSFAGGFIESTYQRETTSLAVQGIGQDIFDLFIAAPLLLISLLLSLRQSRTGIFILGGTVFYILYSFFIYSFGIHFNNLFVLYCFTLGTAFYLFILIIAEFLNADVKNWFEEKIPARSTASYLILIAVLFYYMWFSDIIPAVMNNSVPASVTGYNLLVNPVHVMDLSFVLPGLIIVSLLLIRKHRVGYIFVPVLLIFIVLLSMALSAMTIMLVLRNISADLSLAGIFGVLAIISFIFLIILLKRLKKNTA